MLEMASFVMTMVDDDAVLEAEIVAAGTATASDKVAVAAGFDDHSHRPSVPLRTIAPAAVVAPSTQVPFGPACAVEPNDPFIALTRFAVVVPDVTLGAGVELRSTTGAELPTTAIVTMSVSESEPPDPILPPSLVTIVNVTLPVVLIANTGGDDARNPLILAIVPAKVMLLVPLPVIATPPPDVATSVPADTLSVVVTLTLPEGTSGSDIDRPYSGFGELMTNEPGSKLIGASLTAETAIVATDAALVA